MNMKKNILIIKNLLVLCLSVMITGSSYGDMGGKDRDNPLIDIIVVELFTSQGCSSCLPADDILADLVQQDNILALSYSVDYWNYMG